MSSINLAQLLPALETGGVETGVVDLSNYLSSQKIRNIIIDIRLHVNKFSPEKDTYNHSKDLKLQLRGISIDVEESRESLLAAIKLLESRLDLFRI